MPAIAEVDAKLTELSTLTGLTVDEVLDFISCEPAQQKLIAQSYADMDWVQSPDTFAKVLEILQTVGLLAGVIGGVAGAAGAVAALRSL